HTRANARQGVGGGILDKEAPVDISNVMLVCPHCSRPTRVGHQVVGDDQRVRECKRCGATIENQ
ncbi:MAG TPA: 50S ribosomal protein L24, partial [Blastocatellia bacterium]|nr:50S ribosomal protein L24 [Blastocatellia bacterium]